jgi:hypothetical protein
VLGAEELATLKALFREGSDDSIELPSGTLSTIGTTG